MSFKKDELQMSLFLNLKFTFCIKMFTTKNQLSQGSSIPGLQPSACPQLSACACAGTGPQTRGLAHTGHMWPSHLAAGVNCVSTAQLLGCECTVHPTAWGNCAGTAQPHWCTCTVLDGTMHAHLPWDPGNFFSTIPSHGPQKVEDNLCYALLRIELFFFFLIQDLKFDSPIYSP